MFYLVKKITCYEYSHTHDKACSFSEVLDTKVSEEKNLDDVFTNRKEIVIHFNTAVQLANTARFFPFIRTLFFILYDKR